MSKIFTGNWQFIPSLSTEEPDNSLSIGDKHLDTVPATESDEFIKSGVENLVSILSESEGIPDNMCDVPFHDNSPPLDVSKDQFEDLSDSNDDSTSYDDDSFSVDNIEYVEASPPNSELVSSEETNTFDNSLPKFEIFYFDLEEISSGSTTTRFDISLPEYKAFYDDHVKEISSGSTTTHSDSSLYESDHTEETSSGSTTTHADYSFPEYDLFHFEIDLDQGELTSVVMEDILGEPRVHVPNVLPTCPTLMLDSDFIPSNDSLGSYLE
nr:hypothetical protein [Tanacetum cinerariifolium]